MGDPEDPSDPLHDPPFGSECFIGGLPKGLTEEQLLEFATPAGEVCHDRVEYRNKEFTPNLKQISVLLCTA